MEGAGGWLGRGNGPVVRPYALTEGRTEPAPGAMLDLVAVVTATGPGAAAEDPAELRPEYRTIMALCQQQATVADVVSGTGLPLGVVRVLLGDLIEARHLTVLPPQPADQPGSNLLKEVLHGLRTL